MLHTDSKIVFCKNKETVVTFFHVLSISLLDQKKVALSAGAVECADCFSAEGTTLLRVSWLWSYLPTPSDRAGYDTGSIFKRSLTGLNSEYSFS